MYQSCLSRLVVLVVLNWNKRSCCIWSCHYTLIYTLFKNKNHVYQNEAGLFLIFFKKWGSIVLNLFLNFTESLKKKITEKMIENNHYDIDFWSKLYALFFIFPFFLLSFLSFFLHFLLFFLSQIWGSLFLIVLNFEQKWGSLFL